MNFFSKRYEKRFELTSKNLSRIYCLSVSFQLIPLKVSQPESGESSDEAEMPSTVTKQSSISPVNGVSGQLGVTSSSNNGLHKSSAMIYDTSVNKTTVTSTGGGNNGKKGIKLHRIIKIKHFVYQLSSISHNLHPFLHSYRYIKYFKYL